MIKIHLSKILGMKRINMTKLAEATGLSRNSVFLLYHERVERLDLKTLDKLCVFLDCQPGDLLEHIPNEAE